MYLLDTNVISELRKVGDGKADAAVVAWFSKFDAGEMFISALTLMELEIGIMRVERQDSDHGARLRIWFETKSVPNLKVGPSASMLRSLDVVLNFMFPTQNPIVTP